MLVLLAEHPTVEGREEMKGKGNNVTNFLARSADNSQKDQKLIYLCRANLLGIQHSPALALPPVLSLALHLQLIKVVIAL